MKTFQSILFLLFLAFSFSNCSEDSETLTFEDDQYELDADLKVTTSTDKISKLFFNAGVAKIEVKEVNSSLTFTPLISSLEHFYNRAVLLNNHQVDLTDYTVSMESGSLHLNNDKSVRLTIKDKKPFVISDHFTGYLEGNHSMIQDREVSLLLIFLNELTMSSESKVVFEEEIREIDDNYRMCSFWDTYYSVGVGLNKSAAYANFEHNLLGDLTVGGMGQNCTAIGPPEHTSLGVVHYYTMAFCCP
ncbi:MAG: hypothetical protein HKN68_07860 [Saprospiraceae bacterium]|nr:hypothetical protein [Saprospiraceae bacterium]